MSTAGIFNKDLNEIANFLKDGANVEWLPLVSLLQDRFWIMPSTPEFIENGEVPYITSKNIKGGYISFEKSKYISKEDYIKLSKNRPILSGDILISMIGTIGEVAEVKEKDLYFYGQNMYLIRLNKSIISAGFFLHYFKSPQMKKYFSAVKNNSGQGYLKANNIENILIPIPCQDNKEKSLKIQAEIVRILDKFDTLINSISDGLPREIKLRQQQYEYYRDMLFNFPKNSEVK